MFKLHSEYKPTGDQPQAIEYLSKGIEEGKKFQTLLGVTGSGKTFTMANIIQKVQKPTLVLAHNKTLAGQLYSDLKSFFLKIMLSISFLITTITNQKHIFLLLIRILRRTLLLMMRLINYVILQRLHYLKHEMLLLLHLFHVFMVWVTPLTMSI